MSFGAWAGGIGGSVRTVCGAIGAIHADGGRCRSVREPAGFVARLGRFAERSGRLTLAVAVVIQHVGQRDLWFGEGGLLSDRSDSRRWWKVLFGA